MKPNHINSEHDLPPSMSRAWMYLPDQVKHWLNVGQTIVEEVLIWFTTPIECLCRFRFGTRALSLFLVLQLVAAVFVTLPFLGGPHFVVSLFAMSAAAAAIYHFREARRFEASGGERHSYSPGDPLPFWRYPAIFLKRLGIEYDWIWGDWQITRFWEPALCLALGAPLIHVYPILGYYLIICSVSLLVKGQIMHQRAVDQFRDRMDARIFSKWMAEEPQQSTRPEQPEQIPTFRVRVVSPKTDVESSVQVPVMNGDVNGQAMVSSQSLSPSVACPSCQARIKVKAKHRGRRFPCPGCRMAFDVPA